jgi:tripeptide aminopeptidase
MRAVGAALAGAMLIALVLSAGAPPVQRQVEEIGARLLQDPQVAAALEAAGAGEEQVIADQVRLCEIPAPPFGETARGRALEEAFRSLGLRDVRVDAEGNVIGVRPGRSTRPNVVISAHLDTVFPEGTDVTVRREGPILYGPGIVDDCRGLAVLLGIARALDAGGVQTPGTITFVGTVGEEGAGDLRGVRHLFAKELADRIDRFVSIDGGGLGITHIGVGSRRYKITFTGPGGHSYADFGAPNPLHAMGRAMGAIAALEVPREPRATFSVGRVGGGTSVNSIAFEGWLELDLRSSDTRALADLETRALAAVDQAVEDERERWNGSGKLEADRQLMGSRPSGRIEPDAPIVRAAVSVTQAVGGTARLGEGSTDANFGMSLGIPSITIGGGGRGAGAHTLQESFDTTDSVRGTRRAILLSVALSEP